ncbi:acyl-CoA dehydrogenase family protein [Endozoicomonas ascidiicola]|uniref:acyl-CoA dehydrogenase family protein n=1 Tax=Endozoicomonas ascidiicola TaxID=1698521 RepID=UPI00082C4B44|nr:acyl-CoA dehydrogenase family protein [Endozoicomonas ascidiicola]
MNFTFTEDQLMFHDSVKSFLTNEVTAETLRDRWESESGRSSELWLQLAELGLTAMAVPEAYGGLGMNELDFILLAEECGYTALPEALVETVLVSTPLLKSLGDDQAEFKELWLSRIATGEVRVAIGHPQNLLVADAHIADLLILAHGDEVHAVNPDQVKLTRNASVDPSRQLFSVEWTPAAETMIANESGGKVLWQDALDRGALAVSAQQLGLARKMVDLSVEYTADRKQFGKPIGSFQAVKHLLANVAVQIEFAKSPLYKAAYSVANGLSSRARDVSHARLVTTDAALLAAKNGIQSHGAMGYTWEVDLQIFMKNTWALVSSYGSQGFHKQRIKQFVLAEGSQLGAGSTFAQE